MVLVAEFCVETGIVCETELSKYDGNYCSEVISKKKLTSLYESVCLFFMDIMDAIMVSM